MKLHNDQGEEFFVGINHESWLENVELGSHERKGPPPKGYMLLRATDTSPYVRKVRIVADHLGLAEKLILTPASFLPEDTELIKNNPIGKAPTLLLDDGEVVIESSIIIQYLFSLAPDIGAQFLPPTIEERLKNSKVEAIADALTAAMMAIITERRVHDESAVSDIFISRQENKVQRCLQYLNDESGSVPIISTASIAIACALGYLDWRGPNWNWRSKFPELDKWLAKFCIEFPSYEATNAI